MCMTSQIHVVYTEMIQLLFSKTCTLKPVFKGLCLQATSYELVISFERFCTICSHPTDCWVCEFMPFKEVCIYKNHNIKNHTKSPPHKIVMFCGEIGLSGNYIFFILMCTHECILSIKL